MPKKVQTLCAQRAVRRATLQQSYMLRHALQGASKPFSFLSTLRRNVCTFACFMHE